jgi:hypothetical protein
MVQTHGIKHRRCVRFVDVRGLRSGCAGRCLCERLDLCLPLAHADEYVCTCYTCTPLQPPRYPFITQPFPGLLPFQCRRHHGCANGGVLAATQGCLLEGLLAPGPWGPRHESAAGGGAGARVSVAELHRGAGSEPHTLRPADAALLPRALSQPTMPTLTPAEEPTFSLGNRVGMRVCIGGSDLDCK